MPLPTQAPVSSALVPKIVIAVVMLTSFSPTRVTGEITFELANSQANIARSAPSFGSSWGDVDGDRWPDLWVGNHATAPSLYENLGDGSFVDSADSVWPGVIRDSHGAAWADFDGDGDQDLVESVGGANPNFLFVNDAVQFTDQAASLGAGAPGARGRMPLWLDWNQDGKLDLFLANASNSINSRLMTRTATGFRDDTGIVPGLSGLPSNYAQLADLTLDGELDIVVHGDPFPAVVWDSAQLPGAFVDVRSTLAFPPDDHGTPVDTAMADFDGDLLTDILIAKATGSRELVLASPFEARARLWATSTFHNRIEWAATGGANTSAYFFLNGGVTPQQTLYLGANATPATTFTIVADPSDPALIGVPSVTPGVDEGAFLGFDQALDRWVLIVSSQSQFGFNLIVTSQSPITVFEPIGFPATPPPPMPHFWVRTAAGFEERRTAAGLDVPMNCYSVVSGDFDNDMDVDAYFACAGLVSNTPNVLLENNGDGTFTVVPGAGGAAGTTHGRSESVAVADYDRDGFLDLFVTNGEGGTPFNVGPHELFRNQGNSNNWLEIDLSGPTDNRAGIGARVQVLAGGTWQVREQSGGVHRRAQNHSRLHFGLGTHTVADEVVVKWPGGRTTRLFDQAANRVITVKDRRQTCGLGAEIVPLIGAVIALRTRRARRVGALPR